MIDIWDEVKELAEVRTWADFKDEASDVSFGVGRLIAGLFGKVYVRVPGDRLHVLKIDVRMIRQGCVRSERKVAAGLGCVNDQCLICGKRTCSGECNG